MGSSWFRCGCRAHTGTECDFSGPRDHFIEARVAQLPDLVEIPPRSLYVSRECAKRISEREPAWATLHELPPAPQAIASEVRRFGPP